MLNFQTLNAKLSYDNVENKVLTPGVFPVASKGWLAFVPYRRQSRV